MLNLTIAAWVQTPIQTFIAPDGALTQQFPGASTLAKGPEPGQGKQSFISTAYAAADSGAAFVS